MKETMSKTELEGLASQAFGPEWKVKLAEGLNITRESVWRYATERTPVPHYHVAAIRALCHKIMKAKILKMQNTMKRYPAD